MFGDIHRPRCHLCSSRCSSPRQPQRWHTAGGSATPVEGRVRSKVKGLVNAVGRGMETCEKLVVSGSGGLVPLVEFWLFHWLSLESMRALPSYPSTGKP